MNLNNIFNKIMNEKSQIIPAGPAWDRWVNRFLNMENTAHGVARRLYENAQPLNRPKILTAYEAVNRVDTILEPAWKAGERQYSSTKAYNKYMLRFDHMKTVAQNVAKNISHELNRSDSLG